MWQRWTALDLFACQGLCTIVCGCILYVIFTRAQADDALAADAEDAAVWLTAHQCADGLLAACRVRLCMNRSLSVCAHQPEYGTVV